MNPRRRKKLKSAQSEFTRIGDWGGMRSGAGRPNLSSTVNHMARPKVNLKMPLHLNLKLKKELPSLRNRKLLKEFNKCLKGARELGLYVLHFSIQSNHIHLFAEAESNRALSRGMQGLAGRFAKIIRRHAQHKGYCNKGSVFSGRYFMHVLRTPAETRNALEYVLLNTSKHLKLIEHIDEFSSGRTFQQWERLLGRRFKFLIKSDVDFFRKSKNIAPTAVSPPRSWLSRAGWMKACVTLP